MKVFRVFSGYKQFYVADLDLDPAAPEIWTDEDVANRHLKGNGILALCPETDMSATIHLYWDTDVPEECTFDFSVNVIMDVTGTRIGVMGWPWEAMDVRRSANSQYDVTFSGHNLARIESGDDFYRLWIRPRANQSLRRECMSVHFQAASNFQLPSSLSASASLHRPCTPLSLC